MAWWTILLASSGALSAFYIWPQSRDSLNSWYPSIVHPKDVTPATLMPDDALWDVLRHQGGNSPWIPKVIGVAENTTVDVPNGCRIDQVHMISRHAGRYPTKVSGHRMLELYARIRDSNITLHGDLAFLNNTKFFLDDPSGHFEQLVSTGPYAGTLEAFATGVKLRTAYKALLDHAITQHRVSVWASDSRRVIDTARYFSTGFFGIDWESLADLIIIPESDDRGGDTLTPGKTCLHFANNVNEHGHDYGAQKLLEWRSVYIPSIIERLTKQNPEILFTETEVYSMQELCGFETIAKGFSRWCDVFTHQEWEAFEYARDVLHFYKSGPGNPYGPTMGFLWLNATTNLLQQGSSEGTLFFSFVHDGDIIPLISALNLFPEPQLLPTTHIPSNRTWRTSDVVPMGGRLILERLACPAPQECWDNGPLYPNHVYCATPREDIFVRVNVNDGIVEIPGCGGGPGRSCPLEEFEGMVRKRGAEGPGFADLCGLEEGAAERITFLHQ